MRADVDTHLHPDEDNPYNTLLEDGSGTDAQLSADRGRHGNLTLGRELRLRECHRSLLPR